MSTGISYLDEVINATVGCSGKGCKAFLTCWARELHDRRHEAYLSGRKLPDQYGTPFSEVQFFPDRLKNALRWKKSRRVGISFTGDWMDDQVQCSWIDQILEVISACPQHQFFSLTKQAQSLEKKIYGHCPESPARELGGGDYLPNLWNGVSICDQEDLDRMVHDLLKLPGNKWISIEPQLGPIDLGFGKLVPTPCEKWPNSVTEFATPRRDEIAWVVLGCESGPKRRPCDPQWMIDVVRQCKAAGVPVYVKQVEVSICDDCEAGDPCHACGGGTRVSHDPEEWPEQLRLRELP